MKPLLAAALAFVALPLLAQTTTTTSTTSTTTSPAASQAAPQPGPSTMLDQVTSVLTPAERDQLMSVRLKAMTANPDLQAEEMDLMQKGMSMQSGTATDSDKMAFRQEIKEHADKVRAAMVKVDPTIEPVLQKIEAQVAKLRAQYQAP